jgi:hypothetical protein
LVQRRLTDAWDDYDLDLFNDNPNRTLWKDTEDRALKANYDAYMDVHNCFAILSTMFSRRTPKQVHMRAKKLGLLNHGRADAAKLTLDGDAKVDLEESLELLQRCTRELSRGNTLHVITWLLMKIDFSIEQRQAGEEDGDAAVDVAIVPLLQSGFDALAKRGVVRVLHILCFKAPSPDAGAMYWRVPPNYSSEDLTEIRFALADAVENAGEQVQEEDAAVAQRKLQRKERDEKMRLDRLAQKDALGVEAAAVVESRANAIEQAGAGAADGDGGAAVQFVSEASAAANANAFDAMMAAPPAESSEDELAVDSLSGGMRSTADVHAERALLKAKADEAAAVKAAAKEKRSKKRRCGYSDSDESEGEFSVAVTSEEESFDEEESEEEKTNANDGGDGGGGSDANEKNKQRRELKKQKRAAKKARREQRRVRKKRRSEGGDADADAGNAAVVSVDDDAAAAVVDGAEKKKKGGRLKRRLVRHSDSDDDADADAVDNENDAGAANAADVNVAGGADADAPAEGDATAAAAAAVAAVAMEKGDESEDVAMDEDNDDDDDDVQMAFGSARKKKKMVFSDDDDDE